MKIWIHLNGVQEGPFEEHQLPIYRMTPDTPVWHEGLPDWLPASRVPATAKFFGINIPQNPDGDTIVDTVVEDAPQHIAASYGAAPFAQQQPYAQSYKQEPQAWQQAQLAEEQPASYLVWMILLTVITFNPVGIIGIITGFVVRHRNGIGDFDGARRMSEITAWVLMVVIVMACMRPFTLFI